MPLLPFARVGLTCAGSEGLQRMRGALLDSFRVEDGVAADPGQYSAAIELLLIALSHHPSLVDMMLFPTDLQGSQGKVSLSVVPHLVQKPAEGKAMVAPPSPCQLTLCSNRVDHCRKAFCLVCRQEEEVRTIHLAFPVCLPPDQLWL